MLVHAVSTFFWPGYIVIRRRARHTSSPAQFRLLVLYDTIALSALAHLVLQLYELATCGRYNIYKVLGALLCSQWVNRTCEAYRRRPYPRFRVKNASM